MTRLGFIALMLVACMPLALLAQGTALPMLLAAYDAFKTYRLDKDGARVCYVVTEPDKTTPANVRRDPVHVLLTHRPKDKVRNEISVQLGYPVKAGAPASLEIAGGGSFPLAADGEGAWIADVVKQDLLIESLRKAREFTIKATSVRGTATSDHYPLSGFAKALDRINQECPVR